MYRTFFIEEILGVIAVYLYTKIFQLLNILLYITGVYDQSILTNIDSILNLGVVLLTVFIILRISSLNKEVLLPIYSELM